VTRAFVVLGLLLAVAIATPGAGAVPPALTTPGNLTAEATSAKGAAVQYAVTADDPRAQIGCTPGPGSVFAIGTTSVVCTATGPTGETSRATFTVTVRDTTPPVISGVPGELVKDVNATPAAVVTFEPRASDVVDGSVSVVCNPESGSSFRVGSTRVTCTAVDQRGNAATATFVVRLADSVAPPDVSDVVARGGRGSVDVSWRLPASKDVAGVVVLRYPGPTIVFKGRASSFVDRDVQSGASYRYVVTTFDWGRNQGKGVAVLGAVQQANLIQPPDGATLRTAPLLVWKPARRADYYNVQLWAILPSGPVKIFSTWPRASRLQLGATWKYQGKTYRLGKGRYRWYVWPGIGRIADARYGSLIGTSMFVIG
jgi:HYR domain-containing protein